MILPISLSAAGAAAILNFWLAVRCGQTRTKEGVSIGDGGNDALIRRMRAHANFIEYTPFVLALIVLIEMATGTSTWLWGIMVLYMVGRILHGLGMDAGGFGKGRSIGTIITMLTMIGLGLYAAAIPHLSAGQIDTVDTEAVANE